MAWVLPGRAKASSQCLTGNKRQGRLTGNKSKAGKGKSKLGAALTGDRSQASKQSMVQLRLAAVRLGVRHGPAGRREENLRARTDRPM